jgi:DNA-binding protein H-NS
MSDAQLSSQLERWDCHIILGTLESYSAESHRMNRKFTLDAMSIDEMWQLHEEVSAVLSVRLTSEKRQLEKRLAQLRREKEMRQSEAVDNRANNATRERRKYPRVSAKYRNPNEPSETWSGRGKQPRWLTAALKTGHTIDEFVIRNLESNKSNFRR